MKNDPLISVIVSTYNRKNFVREAIDSIRNQNYSRIELIVVDDGSTDSTGQAIDRTGLKYIHMPHSGLPGKVRNRGVRLASGAYLAFLDSDDLWKPDKIEKQVDFIKKNPEITICHTREIWLRRGRIISQSSQRHSRAGNIFKDALKKCIIGPSTVMLSGQLFKEVGGFDADLEIAEDYDLWLKICSQHMVGYIDEPLVIKRGGHEDQLSEKYGQIEIFRIKALRRNIERGIFRGNNLALARTELAKKYLIYARGCAKRGRTDEAQRFLALAGLENRRLKANAPELSYNGEF